MSRIDSLFPFFILTLLSGCFDFDGDGDPVLPPPSRCVYEVCLVEPTHPDAEYVQEKFSLRQLTRDNTTQFAGIEEYLEDYEDGRVAFQASLSDGEQAYASKAMVYDLATDTLRDSGQGPHYHQTRIHMSNGLVVFSQEALPGAPDFGERKHMVLWDLENNSLQRLDTGLTGVGSAFAFDYPWVLFRNGSNVTSHNGLWALNLDSKELVLVRNGSTHPAPGEGGQTAFLQREDVHAGFAYYNVATFLDERGNEADENFLYETNLETNQTRLLYQGKMSIARLAAGNGFLAFESPTFNTDDLLLLNLTSLAIEQVSTPAEKKVKAVYANGDWIAYDYSTPENWEGIAVVNIRTGQRFHVSADAEMILGKAVTDGENVFMTGGPIGHGNFVEHQLNVYWTGLTGREL